MSETRLCGNSLPDPGVQRLLQAVGMHTALTDAEECALLDRIRTGGREPLDRLIDAYLARVVGIAREYLGQGLGYLDLIAEGTVGLISAARRFDEPHLASFQAYAEGAIRQRILQALGGPA